MKISIITVVLNSAKTIERNLQSILSQKKPHFEIEHILIDGQSTDGTLAILNKHQSEINILISEPDQGLYDAMNKGIALATGSIIGILNADDYYPHKDILSDIHQIFETQDVDAVFGDVEYFNIEEIAHATRLYSSNGFTSKSLEYGKVPAHPSLFVKKEIFVIHGFYKKSYQIAGDFEFMARVFKNNYIKYLYLPKVLVRMQTGGISNKNIRNRVLISQEIYRACKENNIKTNMFKIVYRYLSKIYEFDKLKRMLS